MVDKSNRLMSVGPGRLKVGPNGFPNPKAALGGKGGKEEPKGPIDGRRNGFLSAGLRGKSR